MENPLCTALSSLNEDLILDEDGMVVAAQGLHPPHPWELRESLRYQGIDVTIQLGHIYFVIPFFNYCYIF